MTDYGTASLDAPPGESSGAAQSKGSYASEGASGEATLTNRSVIPFIVIIPRPVSFSLVLGSSGRGVGSRCLSCPRDRLRRANVCIRHGLVGCSL